MIVEIKSLEEEGVVKLEEGGGILKGF